MDRPWLGKPANKSARDPRLDGYDNAFLDVGLGLEKLGFMGTPLKLYNDMMSRGRTEPITEKDFKPHELEQARSMVMDKIRRTNQSAGHIGYEDYPSDWNKNDGILRSLGAFQYSVGDDGNIGIQDRWDFNREKAPLGMGRTGDGSRHTHNMVLDPMAYAAGIGRLVYPHDGKGVHVGINIPPVENKPSESIPPDDTFLRPTPEARRRIATGLMAAQYAENPPAAPLGYDWNAAPLSPSLMNFAAQRGQPGVIQKTLGLIPGFDQDGARGRQSWGNALMSTAQFPIDAVAGMGQAITAPARAYRGEFDPTSEEGVGEALNVAGNAMFGGLAAPKPRNVVGSAGGELKGAALGAIPDMPPSYTSRANSKQIETGYRGSGYADPSKPGAERYWASSDPNLAAEYANFQGMRSGATGTNIVPSEFRFSNPLTVDANGAKWYETPFGGAPQSTDAIANVARDRGHDGLIVRNVVDDISPNHTSPQTSIAALQRGTVYSPLTGDLLYANGGRPGATAGAALGGVDLQDPALAEILRKYGLDVPSRPASPKYRPGDA